MKEVLRACGAVSLGSHSPAGYLGSSIIGAGLIACGFDERASKVASIVIGVFFLFTLWWARKDWLTWVLILAMIGLFVLSGW